MKRVVILLALVFAVTAYGQKTSYESQFAKPLGEALRGVESRFGVVLKYDIDTVGKVVPYADFRIRPYSVEESLTNLLAPFDYKFVPQGDKTYKLKAYEYPRRTDVDGEKMLTYLNSLYADKEQWEPRRAALKEQVSELLDMPRFKALRVAPTPKLSSVRRYDGYSVQNFSLQTLPGLYVCGSIYAPTTKGIHPLIVAPNGHFNMGRYRKDQQQRMATLARMGAVCVDYDLFGWGESELQVGSAAHRTPLSHTIQILNGITIVDYMLSRKDIDPLRIGLNGGSGGGSQVVMLSLLDDRFTAAAPVVSLASHFDGGCPCESGMPVTLACGGTNNAEMMAAFAPRPLLVVSDGKDWTHSVPQLEYPYLQRIYGFYGASDAVSNIHLPTEGHDFGPNKREAVYDFFYRYFALDNSKRDEAKVTIEPVEAMLSFGANGEKLPQNAIKTIDELEQITDRKVQAKVKSDADVLRKASEWVASLNMSDKAASMRVRDVIAKHLRAVRDWHNDHPYTTVPAGINPITGVPLSPLHREVIANSAKPTSIHTALMTGLRRDLTAEQVEKILDKYTVGKVDFTMRGYWGIVPDMTAEDEALLLKYMKQAREEAVDYKSMKQISTIFEIYKDKCEKHFNDTGRSWKVLYKVFTNKLKAEKEAKALKSKQDSEKDKK